MTLPKHHCQMCPLGLAKQHFGEERENLLSITTNTEHGYNCTVTLRCKLFIGLISFWLESIGNGQLQLVPIYLSFEYIYSWISGHRPLADTSSTLQQTVLPPRKTFFFFLFGNCFVLHQYESGNNSFLSRVRMHWKPYFFVLVIFKKSSKNKFNKP